MIDLLLVINQGKPYSITINTVSKSYSYASNEQPLFELSCNASSVQVIAVQMKSYKLQEISGYVAISAMFYFVIFDKIAEIFTIF